MLLFLIVYSLAFSQGEADWWYFGTRAGIHFNPNPVSVNGGQINTTEGVASISDASGNLLFYTDGLTVYNKNHTVMANGTGLMGDPSSTQSGVIVQKPGSRFEYYLFTAALPGSNGYRYSVIDMNLNGGLGGVTAVKNVLMYSPSTEKICAVRHCNNNDVWIITHHWGSNEFRTYLLTSTGLSAPVISSTGTVHSGNTGMAIGCMKASPDGNKLAVAMRYTSGGSSSSILELFDFNNTTGVVSTPVNLGTGFTYAYGLEFSPDGSRLYANSSQSGAIYQFNMCAGNSAQIAASKTQIGTSTTGWMGTMQIGPDKKVYVARYATAYIGVINSPNTLGNGCNYVDNGVALGTNQSTFGLPNFAPNYFSVYTPTLASSINCLTGNFSYTMPPPSCTGSGVVQSMSWNFGDVASGVNNTSTLAAPSHTFSSPGNYTVKLTLNFNCYSDTGILSVNVVSCGTTVSGVGDAVCEGGCGNISATAANGTPPYTYTWTPNIGTGPGPFSVCPTTTTNYKVVATDAAGFKDSTIIQLLVNTLPVATASSTDITCFGSVNGTATASATGNSPFTYSWNTTPVQTTAIANNLGAGNYTVVITDINGCSSSVSTPVSEPALLNISISSFNNVSCNGAADGSAVSTASGGVTPYAYSWNTSPVQTTSTASNLSGGTYTVVVTDANNCTASASVTISEATALVVSMNPPINIRCFGGNDGSASVNTSGGITPYAYAWNTTPVQTTSTASNLTAGNYNVVVTDANSCSASASVTISEPAAFTVNVTSQTNVSCNSGNDGSATATVAGGVTPYNFAWSTTPVQASPTASNLSAATYQVVVTDANSCSASASVTISEPALLNVSIGQFADVSCFGANDGSATTVVTGGTGAYNYTWNTNPVQTTSNATNLSGGTFDVMVTDGNNCTASVSVTISEPALLTVFINSTTDVSCFGGNNGSASVNVSGGISPYTYNWNTTPPQTSSSATNLSAGNYSVLVTDNNSCPATVSATISEPPLLSLTLGTLIPPTCNGYADGEVSVTATGGTPAYQFVWNTIPAQTSSSATNLIGGNYSVTVTDANGCSVAQTLSITEPPLLTVSVNPYPKVEIYSGDNVTLTATPSYTPVNYLWQPTFGLSCANCASTIASPVSTTTYTVIVSDANNCQAQASVEVIVLFRHNIFIPNAFSPNGDGSNDFFEIFGTLEQIQYLAVQVFNRWGEKVYESNEHHFRWDGTYRGEKIPTGVYTYQLKLTFLDGQRDELRKGSVTVLR